MLASVLACTPWISAQTAKPSSKPLPPSKFREDITVIGVPLTEICNREYSEPRQRQLFKNIMCIGALIALLDIEVRERRTFEGSDGRERRRADLLLLGPVLQPRRELVAGVEHDRPHLRRSLSQQLPLHI